MQNGRPVPPSRAAAKEENFVQGDFVVYPTHGVGPALTSRIGFLIR